MEDRYAHPANGDEFREQDANSISTNAALADDRVLFELFRPVPGSATPDKLIIPYASRTWDAIGSATSNALVWGDVSDGNVRVMPFRAIIGSTTVIGTSPIEHMRGQRSGYMVGVSALYRNVAIAANPAGNPRWTLVYAAVTPAAAGDLVTLVNKDPATSIVSSQPRTINTRCTVTLSTVDGATSATPTRPNLPSDGAGTYYIALAYVYVEAGFDTIDPVPREQIMEVAPCAEIHSTTGAVSCAPANQSHTNGGTVDDNQSGTTETKRPGAYLPSTMMGGAKRTFLLQLALSPASHADGDVVDDSIDWRFRYFTWFVHARGGATVASAFASDRRLTPGATPAGSASQKTIGQHVAFGGGQSFVNDSAVMITDATCSGVAMYADESSLSIVGGPYEIQLHVRSTDGALIFKTTGSPTAQFVIHVEATGQYSNFGTI